MILAARFIVEETKTSWVEKLVNPQVCVTFFSLEKPDSSPCRFMHALSITAKTKGSLTPKNE